MKRVALLALALLCSPLSAQDDTPLRVGQALPGSLKSLQDLGLVGATPDGDLFLPNELFRRWIVGTSSAG